MKTLYLALQELSSRAWFPVARVDQLSSDEAGDDIFLLRYTRGVSRFSDFNGFGRMLNTKAHYFSHGLFPLLKNRVISRNRADFSAFARWVGKAESELSYFDEIALTGGLRGTDSMEIIPVPERSADGKYRVSFFVHGVRYLSEREQAEFAHLQAGDQLVLVPEFNNEVDRHALLLKRHGSAHHVGYVPRYFSKDFSELLKAGGAEVQVGVQKVNADAPVAFRVLCSFQAPWPDDFDACRGGDFEPLVDTPDHLHVVA
ncbi:HIRAN domain-containing protein [Stenotrophomonas maltophilia]